MYDEISTRPRQYDDDDVEKRCCFGLQTAQGLLEFECESEVNKQKWVDGIQNLLRQLKAGNVADKIEQSMGFLNIN